VFCDDAVDAYGPKCVRSSAGSVLRLAVVREATSGDALAACAAHGLATVATMVRGATVSDVTDLRRPVALVLGSEAHGLPVAVATRVDEAVTIPMAGPAESLNVAMAGTVLCFEALRQRRRAEGAAETTPEQGDRPRDGQGNRLDETPPRAAGCTTT
jgi:TrmH family RNA methyltransferase